MHIPIPNNTVVSWTATLPEIILFSMIYYSVAGNQGSEAMIGSLNVDGTGGRIVASNEVQDPTDLAVLSDGKVNGII